LKTVLYCNDTGQIQVFLVFARLFYACFPAAGKAGRSLLICPTIKYNLLIAVKGEHGMPHNILLIEDDVQIVEILQSYLTKEGYAVSAEFNGLNGMELFRKRAFDVVMVDIMMPKMDGIEVIKRIREISSVPVLIMSAKDSEVDKALGLGFGADDYIAKPFSLIEVSARIKAAIRRATVYSNGGADTEKALPMPRVIEIGALRIDLDNYSAWKNDTDMKLTVKNLKF
jgi:DNA-binding response OmpR family regulator